MPDQDQFIQQTLMISELLIKISVLQNLLLSKGLIYSEEIELETKKVVATLTSLVEENVKKQENKDILS